MYRLLGCLFVDSSGTYFTRWVGGVLACLLLAACSGGSLSALDTMRLALKGDQSGALYEPQNPAFQYLKVTAYGRPAYLALGYAEPTTGAQVWYSAKGEVIKLQEGRLIGALGLETEWRAVRFQTLPSWQEAVQSASRGMSYQRERDVMPGYQFNVSETLSLRQISVSEVQTKLGKPVAHLSDHKALVWFEETGAADLPSAFYAVNTLVTPPAVVWSYQCLSKSFCLGLEPWAPAVSSQKSGAKAP